MKYSFKDFDNYIDSWVGQTGYGRLVRIAQYSASFVLIMMVGFCTAHFVISSPQWHAEHIQHDFKTIAQAFARLDKECTVLDMRTGVHLLNPLTQKMVSEHELSNTTLKYPENWRGPYLKRIPQLQGKAYQLLKTVSDLFIVPGPGVVLPNGMVVGRDIQWHAHTDVAKLSMIGGPLYYRNVSLAHRIAYRAAPRERVATDPLPADAQAFSGWLAEFNEHMSFAQNQQIAAEITSA